MSIKKFVETLLSIFISYAAAAYAEEDNPAPSGVLFGDIHNVAMGAFNLKENTYLFSIPKDNLPTDRGVIWGEMSTSEYQGNKYTSVSIFDCGPVTSHFGPYKISFSKEDKYLVVESGGEGGSMIDVFNARDLFDGPPESPWNGTDKCVKPIATAGGYNVPLTFERWDGYIPIVSSSIPLDRVSTSEGVVEYQRQGKCCSDDSDDSTEFRWDFIADEFTRAKTR